MQIYNAIIIGAGAAGLTAARFCGADTLVVDGNSGPGKKILVTGGGNCNFSNASVGAGDYVSQNPHFCKSALAGFTPADFLKLLTKHNIKWEEREQGKYFAFNAKYILDMLVAEAQAAGAQFLYNAKIYGVEKDGDIFTVKTAGKDLRARVVIVACGGLSGVKLGASGLAYDIAKSFGLNVVEPYPALTPFLWGAAEQEKFGALSGVSLPAEIKLDRIKIKDDLLFTHYGISGPAALQMSLYTKGAEELKINFLPGIDAAALLDQGRKTNKTFVKIAESVLPASLAKILLSETDVQAANATKEVCAAVINKLTAFTFTPQLNASYLKAEITAGGVDTRELSSSTMECRKVPGLYFAGECLDVSGRLGGYNLHWAWASGAAAGKAIAQKF
ncbi:MAG: NAD(P)/FAD-dependent oxidoreductase [Elusimicrobia bacterium]|nr:NAD(P)/FAD-dependent oxidoreductase [Elusimicrobiota bacterium]